MQNKVLQKTVKFRTFQELACYIFLLTISERLWNSKKKSKYGSLKEDWDEP